MVNLDPNLGRIKFGSRGIGTGARRSRAGWILVGALVTGYCVYRGVSQPPPPAPAPPPTTVPRTPFEAADPSKDLQVVKAEWSRRLRGVVTWDLTLKNTSMVAAYASIRCRTIYGAGGPSELVIKETIAPGQARSFKGLKDPCQGCGGKYGRLLVAGATKLKPSPVPSAKAPARPSSPRPSVSPR